MLSIRISRSLHRTIVLTREGDVERGTRLRFDDRVAARSFLLRTVAQPDDVRRLRTLVWDAGGSRPSDLSDAMVVDQAASLLAGGRVRVFAVAREPPYALRGAEIEEEALGPEPIAVEPPESVRPVAIEPAPPPPVPVEDGSAQARTLVQAAVVGAPFCEECARAAEEQAKAQARAKEREAAEISSPAAVPSRGVDPAAQAATLRRAAVDGEPFCEECARAAAAAA